MNITEIKRKLDNLNIECAYLLRLIWELQGELKNEIARTHDVELTLVVKENGKSEE